MWVATPVKFAYKRSRVAGEGRATKLKLKRRISDADKNVKKVFFTKSSDLSFFDEAENILGRNFSFQYSRKVDE